MRAALTVVTHICCPNCGERGGSVDHLAPGQSFGPWWCDGCGRSYGGTVRAVGDIEVTMGDAFKISTWDLLVLPPQDKPLYFVVEGMDWSNRPKDASNFAFFYEEHSCPTNWLKPEMMAFDGDTDPHGVIRFVRSIRQTEVVESDHGGEDWEAAFPEIISPPSRA